MGQRVLTGGLFLVVGKVFVLSFLLVGFRGRVWGRISDGAGFLFDGKGETGLLRWSGVRHGHGRLGRVGGEVGEDDGGEQWEWGDGRGSKQVKDERR